MTDIPKALYWEIIQRLKMVNRRLKLALAAAGMVVSVLLVLLFRKRKPQ